MGGRRLRTTLWRKVLVVRTGRTKILGSGEPSDQLTWIMNQHWEVLGADPKVFPTVLDGN